MAEYQTLAHRVYCVDALYIQPQVASIYLLRQGAEVAIIETGTFHSLANLLATMAQLGIHDDQVKYVIPTHVHLDHAGGAGAMLHQFKQARLIVHPLGARHMIDPSKLVEGTIGVYGKERFEALYGRIEPIAAERVIVAEDSASYSLEDRELIFIDTPGHARHHFCIYDECSNGMFTGDTFGISYAPMKRLPRGLIPTTPPTQFDPPALRQSIDRIMSFAPARLYLTHYGEFDNPGAQLQSFRRWIDDYVALSQQFDFSADTDAAALESELLQLVMTNLGADADESIRRVISHDITLNAQGLAYWRKRQVNA
jgi:glyoxylase-like metal-dependent hydrolase (beta-lactamase superfamily II)